MTEREKDALLNRKAFFMLPEAGSFAVGITPLVSRNQPTGFVDDRGVSWIAILTDDGLKRQARSSATEAVG